MFRKIRGWWLKLSDGKQVFILVFVHGIYWFFFYQIFVIFWPDDEHESLTANIVQSIWMGIWMTVCMHWSKVKRLFKKKDVSVNR